MNLQGADADGKTRVGARFEDEAEVLSALHEVIDAVDGGCLDCRDVQRVLEGLAQSDGTALVVVRVMRHVASAEVSRHVHEQAGCRHRLVLDADDVVDRLERGARLAPAVAEDVELRVEEVLAGSGRIRDDLLVEARAARVGEDLTGPVVDRHQGSVVHVGGAQAVDVARGRIRPDYAVVVIGVALDGDPQAGQVVDRGLLGAQVGGDDVGLEPLLGRGLHARVERGGDSVAADVDGLAVVGVRARAAQKIGKLLADLLVELGGDHLVLDLGMDDHRLGFGGQDICIRVLADQQTVAQVLAHVLEDAVAAQHDGGVGRDEQGAVRLFYRVLDEVIRRRCLQQRGQDHGLSDRQLAEVRDAEVALGRGGDAVALVPVVVEVQVVGDDRLLALLPRELLGQADRLDDFLDLPVDRARGGRKQPCPHELLGDGGGAAREAGNGVPEGRKDGRRVDALVRPEGLVFGAGGGIEDDRRDLGICEDTPVLRTKGGQLDRARSVEDDGLLVEVDALEKFLGVAEVAAIRGVDVHGSDERDDAGEHEAREQEQREDDGEASGGSSSGSGRDVSIAPTTSASSEAGLHGGSQDSIRR